MQHRSRLFRPLTSETPPAYTLERFDACAFLADRIHALAAGRPFLIEGGRVDCREYSGQALRIAFEDGAAETLGWAVVGEPELALRLQDEMLVGALWRLRPDRDLSEWAA